MDNNFIILSDRQLITIANEVMLYLKVHNECYDKLQLKIYNKDDVKFELKFLEGEKECQ